MSRQQDAYLTARAEGVTMHSAAADTGISIAEARLIEANIGRGEIELPQPAPTHNQKDEEMSSTSVAADELRLLIERIERLEEEKRAIADDIKDVYAEAKSRGYDTRTMRECVKLRKMERHVRNERETLLDTYKAALGLDYAETPLGQAALRAVG